MYLFDEYQIHAETESASLTLTIRILAASA